MHFNDFYIMLYSLQLFSLHLNLGNDMRTTIDIDEQLLLYAKNQAALQNTSLKNVLENALRNFFSQQQIPQKTIKLETCSGAGLKAEVNLNNSQSLNEIMDGY